jgi:hypothetical protein
MRLIKTPRGFERVIHVAYPTSLGSSIDMLIQQSCGIGEYLDAFDRPGSSYLWITDDFHLNREEVEHLRDRLTAWLSTGSLRLPLDDALGD